MNWLGDSFRVQSRGSPCSSKKVEHSQILNELGNNACCTPVAYSKMKLKNINKTGAYGILQYAKR
jgi:hypothetical protein